MATEYSIQKMVSDGTLSTIALGIQYLQRNDIYIRIAGEGTPQIGAPSGYTWSFINNTTLKILPVVPNGVEVVIYRRTDVDAMYNVYSQNAQFDERTIDENNTQLLYIAQEYLEQGIPGAGVDTIAFVRDDGSNTYYRIKRTDGSYSDEFAVPSAGNAAKIISREALRRTYEESGFTLVDGSFEAGGELTNVRDVLLYESNAKAYSWKSVFPKVVSPASTPNSDWFDVSPLTLSQDTTLKDAGFISTSTMTRLNKIGAKVVLVGDSLSTLYSIDGTNNTATFDAFVRRQVTEINGTVKFYNRAIAGTRYYELGKQTPHVASIEAYPWYVDAGRRWMDYIADIKPDIIVLAFGMNDGNGWDAGAFQQSVFMTMMEELNTIASHPEIIFCTNILPSNEHPSTSSFAAQNGRDAMAGWTRSYAKKYGYSYIDTHRRFKMLRDGVDVESLSYARRVTNLTTTLPYTYSGGMCDSYSAKVRLTSAAVAEAGIQFQLSSYATNLLSLRYIDSKWRTTVYTGLSTDVGASIIHYADGAAPTAGTEINFVMNGDTVTITVGQNTEPVFNGQVVRFGGKFIPSLGGSGDVVVYIMVGSYIETEPALIDSDIYNTPTIDGGNDLNHPTAKASSTIYSAALESAFRAPKGCAVRYAVEVDFLAWAMTVSSSSTPNITGKFNLSDVLTFTAGGIEFAKDPVGNALGAKFGTVNRAYIDGTKLFDLTGPIKTVQIEVEFIVPTGSTYIVTLGESTVSDRLQLRVSSLLSMQGLTVSNGIAAEVFSNTTKPYTRSRLVTVQYSIDCDTSIALLNEDVGFQRGGAIVHTIPTINPATLSKLKFGYAGASTFLADVIIKTIKMNVL